MNKWDINNYFITPESEDEMVNLIETTFEGNAKAAAWFGVMVAANYLALKHNSELMDWRKDATISPPTKTQH
jgi:hypothetical protein